jgi:hypothetical protein
MLLSYTLPAEPSSKRVLVWRHLRKLGAVLDSGVWLLPWSAELEPEFRAARDKVEDLGGRPLAFMVEHLTDGQAAGFKSVFNQARREEYDELLAMCRRYLGHIARLIDAGEYKFTLVEELEQDLEKRRRSLAQLIPRDVFHVEERISVETCLQECEEALARFTERVFMETSA